MTITEFWNPPVNAIARTRMCDGCPARPHGKSPEPRMGGDPHRCHTAPSVLCAGSCGDAKALYRQLYEEANL